LQGFYAVSTELEVVSLNVSRYDSTMHWRKTSVNPSYRCPLCDRGPRDYYTSTVLPQPICGACTDFLDMACLEDERPKDPEVDCLEALVRMGWEEYRIALVRKNLATWREIQEDPQKEYIQKYMKWSDWTEAETREYVRNVIRDLEETLRRAVGGELQ
jgi:hypothetical protein